MGLRAFTSRQTWGHSIFRYLPPQVVFGEIFKEITNGNLDTLLNWNSRIQKVHNK